MMYGFYNNKNILSFDSFVMVVIVVVVVVVVVYCNN